MNEIDIATAHAEALEIDAMRTESLAAMDRLRPGLLQHMDWAIGHRISRDFTEADAIERDHEEALAADRLRTTTAG
jgi:hypothetical protein